MGTHVFIIYGGFAISTVLCAAAADFGWLLAARAVSGAFGGIAAAAGEHGGDGQHGRQAMVLSSGAAAIR